MKTRTYGHVTRGGKPTVVRAPRGSMDEPAQFTENVILSAAGRLIGRALGGRRS